MTYHVGFMGSLDPLTFSLLLVLWLVSVLPDDLLHVIKGIACDGCMYRYSCDHELPLLA